MPYYIPCETPGCRHTKDLELCDVCQALVCDLHSVAIAGGKRRCRKCAGVPLKAVRQPQQLDLFSSVRPQGKRPARDGLQQPRG